MKGTREFRVAGFHVTVTNEMRSLHEFTIRSCVAHTAIGPIDGTNDVLITCKKITVMRDVRNYIAAKGFTYKGLLELKEYVEEVFNTELPEIMRQLYDL